MRLLNHSILIAALIAVGTLSPAQAQSQPEKVTVRADVFFYGAHAPVMVGILDGIYKKHSLDVNFVTGRGSATTIQTVANQSDDFGLADGAALVRLVAQGLRAKQVMGLLQKTSFSVLTLPDSGIKTPQDLNGKTTGFAPGSATDQIFPAFAKRAGVDFSSIKGLSVDATTRDNLFLLKKIDFNIALAVAQLPILEEKCACKLNVFPIADFGLNLISTGVVASDKLIADKPDLVHRFIVATVEATKASIASPEHAADAFMQYTKNSGLSRDVVLKQWIVATKSLHTDRNKDLPLGQMTTGDWQETIDTLVEYANLKKDAVTPDRVFTNDFVPN
jgi:NitT/TauT family transport system substrate-binding protein